MTLECDRTGIKYGLMQIMGDFSTRVGSGPVEMFELTSAAEEILTAIE